MKARLLPSAGLCGACGETHSEETEKRSPSWRDAASAAPFTSHTHAPAIHISVPVSAGDAAGQVRPLPPRMGVAVRGHIRAHSAHQARVDSVASCLIRVPAACLQPGLLC